MAVEQEVTQTPNTNINSIWLITGGKKLKHDQKYACILGTVEENVLYMITKRQIILYCCGMLHEIPAKHLQVV
jgi:hypothetical protein